MKNLSLKAILFVGVLALSFGSFIYLNSVAPTMSDAQVESYEENELNDDHIQQAEFPEVQLLKKIIRKSQLLY